MANRKRVCWNGPYECTCYHPLFLFNQFGDLEVAPSVPAKSIAPMAGRACSSRSSPGAVSVAMFPMWGASFIPSKSEDEVARRTPCFGACAALELDGDGAERGRFTLTGGGRPARGARTSGKAKSAWPRVLRFPAS